VTLVCETPLTLGELSPLLSVSWYPPENSKAKPLNFSLNFIFCDIAVLDEKAVEEVAVGIFELTYFFATSKS
jgi:hypothetical protein